MRFYRTTIAAILSAVVLAATFIYLPEAATANRLVSNVSGSAPEPQPTPTRQVRITEADVENNDLRKNGIDVAQPKIYDDALLQQMLNTAEARLAALEVINQPAILARLGSVTGATQQTSSFGLNIQGPSVPGVTTTTKLPTETVTDSSQTTAAGATSSSLETVSGSAVRDEVTTRAGFSPPPAVAPAPTTTLPSAFSVSASDILNEQMQLTAEINGLRLLLSGSLTDYFLPHRPGQTTDEQELARLRTTLGFHVSLTPDRRYKDAVAIVEVEIGTRDLIERGFRRFLKTDAGKGQCPEDEEKREKCIQETVARRMGQRGTPAVTALIPREKTYNVAAITDKSTSIGGGVATQIIGFSGSWVRGHKTYYLVQDQDTVALSYRPIDRDNIGFRWQFRPVLGQSYVKAGLKQTFVQIAFPTPEDSKDGEIGSVAVRTYWRRYDRKAGIVKEIIPHSLNEMYRDIDIPRFKQPVMPVAVDLAQNIEDLGGGQILVNLVGRFLPGTYVRIGATPLTEGPRFKQEYRSIKFTAPISELATKPIFLVAHDGTEEELKLTTSPCDGAKTPLQISEPSVTPVDATTSRLKVRITPNDLAPDVPTEPGRLRKLLFVIGQRVFGDVDAPLQREQDTAANKVFLSALVPNTVYAPNAKLVVKPLFAKSDCTSNALDISGSKPAGPERIVPLEQGEREIRYLLSGNNLNELRIVSPEDGRLEEIPNVKKEDANKMRVLVLSPYDLKTHKQVLLQRGTDRPFLLTIPEFDPKPPAPPKALGTIPVKSDEVIITGEGLADVDSITFRETPITTFKIVNDQTLRLSGLSAIDLTTRAGTQRIFIKFKSGRTAEVDIRVVDNIVDTRP
jgi:hypothetical protein